MNGREFCLPKGIPCGYRDFCEHSVNADVSCRILPAGVPHCVDTITDSFAAGGHFITTAAIHHCLSSFAITSAITHVTNEDVKPRILDLVLSLDLSLVPNLVQLSDAISNLPLGGRGPQWARFNRAKEEIVSRIRDLLHKQMAGSRPRSFNNM